MPNIFVTLPVPAADGVGASVDVSGAGRFKTFVLVGAVPNSAVYAVEISQDDVHWDTLANLAGQNKPQVLEATCKSIRVRRKATGAAPSITMGAEDTAAAGGGGDRAVSDVHVLGNPGIVGSVELVAGASMSITQGGNQIVVAANIPPAPPGGETSIFFTYPHDPLSVGPGGPETLVYQHAISYGAMLPPGALMGYFRGLYSLNQGGATVRLRRDQNNQADVVSGDVIGSADVTATGGPFGPFGFDPIDINAFGIVLLKVTVEVLDPQGVFRMQGATLKMLRAAVGPT